MTETHHRGLVRNEGQPDIVQISGGEPTIHPQFFEILDAAKRRPIKHLMVNTNGVRLAHDDGFAERLAGYLPGLEVYLQFDSFERDALLELRGADLRTVRVRALERLNRPAEALPHLRMASAMHPSEEYAEAVRRVMTRD